MLSRLLESAVDDALHALEADGPLADQLDASLQRWAGDLTETFRATEHGVDLIEAKAAYAKPVVDAANKRLLEGLAVHLDASASGRGRELTELLIRPEIRPAVNAITPFTAPFARRVGRAQRRTNQPMTNGTGGNAPHIFTRSFMVQ